MTDDASVRKSHARGQFNSIAADYDAGPGCFAHFGKRLVAAAEVQLGHRVLDVASGRGAVLFPCAERVGPNGDVVGVDLASEMARATNEDAARRGILARVRVMDAEHLDFPDAEFDRVLCGFGIMFMPDQTRALDGFRRVLKPGGRIALSTWRVSQTSQIVAAMSDMGMQRAKLPGWITEPGNLAKLVATAAFTNVSVTIDSHSFRYADVDEYWRQARSTGMRQVLDELGALNADRLRGALVRRLNPDGNREFYSKSTALIAVANR